MITEQLIESQKQVCDRRLMLFDLSIRGHHPNYILYLIRYWSTQELSGHLDIVVSARFLQEHGDVVALAKKSSNIQFVAIALEEETALRSRKSKIGRIWRNFQEWQLLCQYASKLKATHCIILYFDTYFLPIALGATPPCSFSGIYFRPTFHYAQFSGYTPSRWDSWQQWREKFLLSRILSNPKLKTLFCLDPFAVKHLEQLNLAMKAVHLSDPVETYQSSELELGSIKEKLGIDRDRQVLLLFGALNERKGIYQLLEAILQLSPQFCQKLCLLLVGESSVAPQLETQIAAVCQAKPVQIIRRYEFVSEQEMQAYFQLADVILAPYQRHVGMSGILLLAAAFQKPVLSSDYGLMGELVRRYGLGLTIDSSNPSKIAQGLTQFLLKCPADLCDAKQMKTFVEQNSAQSFARNIFDRE